MKNSASLVSAHSAPTMGAGGYAFTVHSDDEAIERALRDLLAALTHSAPSCPPERFWIRRRRDLRGDVALFALDRIRPGRPRREVQDAAPLATVLDVIFSFVTRGTLDATADRLHLHAAGLERDRVAVLLTGPSGSGKSTLAYRLLSAGYSYLSDEMVGVDEAGVFAYPKPVSLKKGSWPLFPELAGHSRIPNLQPDWVQYAPCSVTVAGEPLDAGAILAVRHDRGAESTMKELDRATMIQRLIDNSFDSRRFGGDALRILDRLTASSFCGELTFGQVDDAVGLVTDALDRRPSSARPVGRSLTPRLTPGHSGPTVRAGVTGIRVDAHGVLRDEANGHVLVVDHNAVAVLERLDGARSARQLADELASPGDDWHRVERDILAFLGSLESLGLLVPPEPSRA